MLNQVQIIGFLGRDPEARTFPSGGRVCNFTVATTEKWKDKQTGERKESTEWHRISAFGRLAEVCDEYLRKGSLVFVQGKLTTRKWTDAQGVERYTTEIRCEEMKMLGGARDDDEQDRGGYSAPSRAPAPAPRAPAPTARRPATTGGDFDDLDSDIPF